ncbi:restriction endonuclease subunit S [Fusobacterium nucleatum]|uniref:restriction endonuclease subunit S n=1 Tax=Fusobacterium nucleatum TaxID=851 RepID=UPI0030D5E2EC
MKIFNKNEWKKVKLGDVCEVITGNTPLKKIEEYWDKDEVPFITPPELKYEGINYITPNIYVSKIGAKQGRIIPKNSICVCCIGSLGKLGILKEDAITNQQINSLILKDKNVDLLYLYFYLKTIKNNLESIASSTTVKIINKSSFEKIEISLPNLEIQKKISKKLELLENNIKLRKSQLVFLKELTKSLFTTMFGDILNNSLNWRQVKLEDLCSSIVRGPFGSSLKKEFFVKNGYKVYEQKNAINQSADLGEYYINEEKFKELKRFECKTKDIIMSCSGTVGKLFQLPEGSKKGVINQALCKFSLNNKTVSIYFLKCLEKIMENLKLNGSGIKNISSVSYLRKIDISLPPIELQNKFAERIEKIEKLKFEIEKSIEMAQNLYNSLISKYFDN